MVLQTAATITNANVNSGSTIVLNAKNINTNWGIFTNKTDKPRVSVAASYATTLATGINTGFSNPTHTITGTYDLTQSHTTGTGAFIDREYIEDLINNAHKVVVLKADKFKTTSNTTGEINVMLQTYSDVSENTNVINYTMVFLEVKEE